MKVLVSAYACEPEKGSEPGVGWNSVCQAARFHDVWVITRSKNRSSIEAALLRQPMPHVRWVYFAPPRWARLWRKEQRGHYYYYLWQVGAYFISKALHRQMRFDLIHHVTFVNYWIPSFLALLPVPFVWGPVGGGESAPRAFWCSFSLRGVIYEVLRDFGRSLGEFDPFVRLTAQRARLGAATSEETALRLRKLGCRKVMVLSGVALPEDDIARLGDFAVRQSNPFRLVSVGSLLHLKGFELGLRAFACFQSGFLAEYWIIGDGPERKRLEKLTRELHIADRVVFEGAIPRREVLEKLAECDVLLHPALHESGGWVCLEAMAAGRPVICLNIGGPALQVTEETGIKIPAISPKQVVAELSKAIERLARDPVRRARLGQAGRERVQRLFSWEKKGEHMAVLYAELVTTKPEEEPQAALV